MTLGAVALIAVAACSDGPVLVCPGDLRVRYEPRETTLGVGQTFTPKVEYLGCGGTRVLETPIVYASTDAAVLEVDPVSGLAQARSVGEAFLVADAPEYHFPVRISVTVTAAAP